MACNAATHDSIVRGRRSQSVGKQVGVYAMFQGLLTPL